MIRLSTRGRDGKNLEATFLPEKGMNLTSLRFGNIEIIDPSTTGLFEERFAGLGALIGPHFHRKQARVVPKIADESLFPHIARVRAKGVEDPFSHGIGRYAPWKAEATSTKVHAVLSGKDLWNGVTLSSLEGQNFSMVYDAEVAENALIISMSVVSDADSLVGIHYYYRLPKGKGKIRSAVQNYYVDQGVKKNITDLKGIQVNPQNECILDLDQPTDFTFYPFPNPREGLIFLETEEYILKTHYECKNQENCWQLYHPAGASFVCIEPLSSQDPRHPNLTVSSLKIRLEIQEVLCK